MRRHGARPSGYALVALMASIAIMLLALSAAAPSWRYLVRNDRELELIFRGGEIADAIGRYQRRNGNALPVSLDVLVKGKYLRRAYKDPMSKDGGWRFIRPGEVLLPGQSPFPGGRGSSGDRTSTTTTTTRPSAFSRPAGVMAAFQGVASTSQEKSLRLFNGRSRYDEWVFAPGLPRVIGRPSGLPAGLPGGNRSGQQQSLQPAIPPAAPGAVGPPGQWYVVPP